MKDTIKEELQQFEEEYNITILAARDTGSRAWNLESEESDYDVSFIYIQDNYKYIAPTGYKQNIDRESQTEHDIEYNSWNLDRFLALLKASNPSAIEFLQSDLKYYEPYSDYMQKLEDHAEENFKPLALMKHHHNLAKKQFERYIKDGKKHTYKRHLYCIRSLLCRKYIQETKQLPTLDFPEFIDTQDMHFGEWKPYRREIKQMVQKKKNGAGSDTVRTRKLAEKIGRDLENEIPDDEKPDYAQQNIDTAYLAHWTQELIKEINQSPSRWSKCLSTLKKLTNN